MVRRTEVKELYLVEASVLAMLAEHLQATEVELPDTFLGVGLGREEERVSTEAWLSQPRLQKIV